MATRPNLSAFLRQVGLPCRRREESARPIALTCQKGKFENFQRFVTDSDGSFTARFTNWRCQGRRPTAPSFKHASNATDVDPTVTHTLDDEPATMNGEYSPDVKVMRKQTDPNLSMCESLDCTHSSAPSESGSGFDLEPMASRDSHRSTLGSSSAQVSPSISLTHQITGGRTCLALKRSQINLPMYMLWVTEPNPCSNMAVRAFQAP